MMHYVPGGPLLFNMGNEGSVRSKVTIIQTGLLHSLAIKLRAAVLYSEHRYYGKSLPFSNESFVPNKLIHLTMENAMADYVKGILLGRNSCLCLSIQQQRKGARA